jgi:glc operon protein GlcG
MMKSRENQLMRNDRDTSTNTTRLVLTPPACLLLMLGFCVPWVSAQESNAGSRNPSPEQASSAPEASRPLVLRNRVHLTLEGARTIMAAAQKKAQAMKLKMNIAVVDDGGHLVCFERMEGARPASGYTAITKATTAATFRQPTGPLPTGTKNPDPLLNLSLQNAAMASGGKITTLYGGVPIVVDGQIIGAVGAGGGSGEQDAEVVRAGIQALLDALARSDSATGESVPARP